MTDYIWKPANGAGQLVGSTRRLETPDPQKHYTITVKNRKHDLYYSKLFSSWVIESKEKVLPLRLSDEQAKTLCNKQ